MGKLKPKGGNRTGPAFYNLLNAYDEATRLVVSLT
jgi:hypothetical protein